MAEAPAFIPEFALKDQSLTFPNYGARRRWQVVLDDALCHRLSLSLAGLVLISAVFFIFPGLDLATSRLFYGPAVGFALASNQALRILRGIGVDLTWLYCLLAIALLAVGLAVRKPLLWRKGLFLAGVMVIGPGLLINAVLKNHWGRARPRDIVDFGGTMPFSRVWEIVPYCKSNCSFVSGEGGASFALLALLFIIPRRFRMIAAFPLLGIISLISFNRILFGGHFLSDTLISWAIVMVVMLVLERLLLGAIADSDDHRRSQRCKTAKASSANVDAFSFPAFQKNAVRAAGSDCPCAGHRRAVRILEPDRRGTGGPDPCVRPRDHFRTARAWRS